MKFIGKLFKRLHDSGKYGRKSAYFLAYLILSPFWFSGLLLFWISRPIVALSHLLMGNLHTAKEAITEINPWTSVRDF
jgi:hypothetical protein